MLPEGTLLDEKGAIRAITEGFLLDFTDLGTGVPDPKKVLLTQAALVVSDPASQEAPFSLGQILAEATIVGMCLINAPANQLTPKDLADQACFLAEKTGFFGWAQTP